MRKHIRDAMNEVRRHGGRPLEITEGGRHTELLIEVGGRRIVLRFHRGAKNDPRVPAYIRAALRSALRSI
jgi:hypothetical protein